MFNSMPINATEGGGTNYLPGFYGDFGLAVFPEPGTYFNNFFAAYQDTRSDTGTLLEMPGIIHVTEKSLLGGQFIVGLYPGMLASKDHTGENSFNRVGLGDFYLVPGGLNWKWDTFTAFLFEGIVAPTGRYQVNDFNTGRNYWTFDHNLLLTWSLPANNEISVGLGYMNNLKNPATDYQSGDEFHMDYTVAHYPTPTIGIGVAGSYYKQVNKDRAPQSFVLPEPGEASSIGPAIMYTPRINDRDITLSLKWLREFNVTGRAEQEYLVCRLFMAF
ncbi:SphA family protein [Candidatus Methylobacter oryzae]|nr:transporter [Candidatus Methylobacter oryzae]